MEAARAAFAGIHPGWAKLFAAVPGAAGALSAGFCGAAGQPTPAQVLGAFKHFGPAATRAVIVCQGLFPDATCPLAEPQPLAVGGAGRDFRHWACQGVLLLGAPRGVWAPFVAALVAAIADLKQGFGSGARPAFLFWGDTGGVPLPAGGFRDTCARKLAELAAPPVAWDELPSVGGCDGACSKNGSPDARAGFGVCVSHGPLAGFTAAGPVAPYEYAWVDAANPLLGFAPTAIPARPSNNRGEYLAFCVLLLAFCRLGPVQPVWVISDSKILLDLMGAGLAKRRRKGSAHLLKNYDLVCLAERLLALIRGCGAPVQLMHVRSHQPPPAGHGLDALFWAVNDRADKLAGEGEKLAAPEVSAAHWLPCFPSK